MTGRGMSIYIYAYGTLRLLKIIFIRDAIVIKLQCTFSNKLIKVWLQYIILMKFKVP